MKVRFYALASLVIIINGICAETLIGKITASVLKVDTVFAQTAKELDIEGSPKLVKGARTYVNRNGYTVFHGYGYEDLSPEESLRAAKEFRAERNLRSSSGLPRQRTTNFRYLSAVDRYNEFNFHSSASVDEKKEVALGRNKEVRNTLAVRREVGRKQEARVEKTVRGRISLRQTDTLGTALRHRISKQKVEEYQEWASEVWKQDRKKDTSNPKLKKGISRIKIKNVRESREVPLFYVRPEDVEKVGEDEVMSSEE